MTKAWRAIVLVLAVVGAACTDDGPPPPTVGGFTDGAAPGGRIIVDAAVHADSGRADGGYGDGGYGDAVPGIGDAQIAKNVTVTITSPTEKSVQAITNTFVPHATVHVVDESKTGAPDGVVAQVWTADWMKLVATGTLDADARQALAELDAADYIYKTKPVDLKGLVSGDYVLHVVVTMKDGSVAFADVKFRVDAGPTIDVRKPTEGQPLHKTATIDVVVTDAVFGPVKTVTMTIGKYAIDLSPPDDQGVRSATITFDRPPFDPPLDGEQLITVVATNANDTPSQVTRKFVVDNDGPEITDAHPADGELIGGIITIKADIADKWAGVSDKSVTAVIAHGDSSFTVKLDPVAGAAKPTYSARFDTRLLPANALFPHISFRASDTLGNESSIGYLVSLDNTPPLADLDPPSRFRAFRKNNGNLECSWPFDPVGPDAVDDGVLVNQLFDVRARIEDQGNAVLGGSTDFVPIATVDEKSVALYVLDDTTKPLVVDTNGDKVCDAVNPTLVPTTTPMSSNDALLVNMVPLAPTGVADFTPEPNAPCRTGTVTMPPEPLCDTTYDGSKTVYGVHPPANPGDPSPISLHSSAMSFVMSYAVSTLPAIWTLPPIVNNKLQCAGRQLDALGSNVTDGWVCLAVAAADALGNMQVSRVLRVCVDKDANGKECPHVQIESVSSGSPMVVTTKAAHGLTTGEEVMVSDVLGQTGANGRWKVTVTDATTFSLDGSAGLMDLADGGMGFVVATKNIPNCTGTQTAKTPSPMITDTPCKPWNEYDPRNDARVF